MLMILYHIYKYIHDMTFKNKYLFQNLIILLRKNLC